MSHESVKESINEYLKRYEYQKGDSGLWIPHEAYKQIYRLSAGDYFKSIDAAYIYGFMMGERHAKKK